MAAPPKSAGTDQLSDEIDKINAELANHEQRIAALEAGGGSNPEPPDPNPEPPDGGGGDGEFHWDGVNTVWPTAATTGPRVATSASSKLSYGTAGEKVNGKKFQGKVVVTADNVVFTDCEFLGATDWGCDADSRKVTFDHCRFTGGGTTTSQKGAAILGVAQVLYCDISKFEDGIKLQGANCIVRGCYIHDPMGAPEGHYDGIQVSGANSNVLIEQNSIKWKDTSCVFIKPDFGAINGAIVKNNRLEGGGFRVYFDNQKNLGLTGGKLIQNLLVAGGYDYYTVSNCAVEKSGNINQSGQAVG